MQVDLPLVTDPELAFSLGLIDADGNALGAAKAATSKKKRRVKAAPPPSNSALKREAERKRKRMAKSEKLFGCLGLS
jgi:hypothetical protein